jgi:hypothetical protein
MQKTKRKSRVLLAAGVSVALASLPNCGVFKNTADGGSADGGFDPFTGGNLLPPVCPDGSNNYPCEDAGVLGGDR